VIGKLCTIKTPYYDTTTKAMSFKARPALVIGKADTNEFVILPVSSVTDRSKLDPSYDIKIGPLSQPLLNLAHECYVRTHKQTVAHSASVVKTIGDMKTDYPDLYADVLCKVEEFQSRLIDEAI